MIHPICTQYNSQSFKGLHAKPKDLRNLNTTKNYLLEIPEIKNCADNYEITIKKVQKIVNPAFKRACKLLTLGAATILTTATAIDMGIAAESIWTIGLHMIGAGCAALGLVTLPGAGRNYRNIYTMQGGKNYNNDQLSGSITKEYEIERLSDYYYDNAQVLGKTASKIYNEIERKEKNRFIDILAKYDTEKFNEPEQYISIIKDFGDAFCFNYNIDTEGNSLLTKFFDVIPTNNNLEEYEKVIDILKNTKNINYNQRDNFGIPILEKILNSENSQALELVKDFEFDYSPELDYAFENITDEIFKLKAKNLNIIRGK